MATRSKAQPVVLDVEFGVGQFPVEFQHAVKFALRHDRSVVIGYVEDENKFYLMTVETDSL